MSLRRRAGAGDRAGFTLVEVLLTLLIMGGIMLSMTTILTAARTSRDTIHNIQESQLAGPAILDLVERDLRALFVYDREPGSVLRVKNRVMLGIDADSLDFVASTDSLVLQNYADRYVRTDANEIGYRLKKAHDSDQFLELYRREGFGVDGDPFEGGNFVFLHERVKGFDIQCFASDGPDQDPLDEWDPQSSGEKAGLPARIQIVLTLELAPRLVNEELRIASLERRTMVYRRVIRVPESLRVDREAIPIPLVPTKPKPKAAGAAGPAAAAAGDPSSADSAGKPLGLDLGGNQPPPQGGGNPFAPPQ